ncbi:SBBP repeat-containing protein [Mycobacterium sp. LTG2003]
MFAGDRDVAVCRCAVAGGEHGVPVCRTSGLDRAQLPFSAIKSPTGIAVDGDGNVYVIAAIRDRGRQIIRLGAE